MCGVVSYNDWRLMERSRQPKPAKHATIDPNVSERDDKSKGENRGEIEVSLRRALIWSLLAHLAVIWIARNDGAFEGDQAAHPFAVKIASSTSVTPRLASPPALPRAPTKTSTVLSSTDSPPLRLPVATATTNALPSPDQRIELSNSLPVVAVGALNSEGLRGYRLALAREARRVWRYPPQAVDARWQGTSEIRLELLPSGQLLSANIEKSSGHAVLDEAARTMMMNAAGATQVPASLLGNPLSIVLPVKFSLATDDDRKPSQQD